MYKKRSKLAQTTLFIIVGLVAVTLILLVIYLSGLLTKEDQFTTKSSDPVVAFTQECVQKVAEQGLIRAGQQGGYIYLDNYPLDAVEYSPFNSPVLKASNYQYIPYWYYQKDAGLDRTEMPALEKTGPGDNSIQDQLERYISAELEACLDSYTAFAQQGMKVTPTGGIKTDVIFTDEDVVVSVNYPLKVDKTDGTKDLELFGAKIGTKFKNVYNYAKDIAQYEQTTTFLEQNAMNLITMYSAVDKDYLPPLFGGMQIEDCGDLVFWMEDDVVANFKQIMSLNIPFVKIKDSDFERVLVKNEEDPDTRDTKQGIFDLMIKDINNPQPKTSVLFEYRPNFPLYFDMGQKGMIRPTTQVDFNYLFGRKCVFVYKFAYSFKFPVLVTLVDKDSKINNQPYIFQFPLQVITKANFPRVALTDVFGLEPKQKETYLCDQTQRISEESIVNVADKASGKPLEDAMINFQCGPAFVDEYDVNGSLTNSTPFSPKCFIGKTGKDGKMSSKFPPCLGGATVVAEKKGYSDEAILIGDVVPGKKFTTLLEMDRKSKLNVQVKKYYVIPPVEKEDLSQATMSGLTIKQGVVLGEGGEVVQCNLYTPPSDVEKNEDAIITMRKIDPTLSPSNPYTFIFYREDDEMPDEIEIGPGTYQIEILFVRNQKWKGELDVKKDSQSLTVDEGLFKGEKTIYYPEDDIEMESVITGGAVYVTTIEEDELDGADTITFFTFDEGKPQKLSNYFVALGHRDACSGLNINKIQPILSKS